MDGYKLTIKQKDSIQGVMYAPDQYFNCVQDINADWFTFLSADDIVIVTNSEWAWILDCPFVEYIPPIPPTPINE
jgi:hypothetical protein